jgi:hypothetical protein
MLVCFRARLFFDPTTFLSTSTLVDELFGIALSEELVEPQLKDQQLLLTE